MTRDKVLVAAVHVGAIVRVEVLPIIIQEKVTRVVDAVVLASAIPEEAIPHDVAAAALALLAWKFDEAPEPEWLIEWKCSSRAW